MCFFPSCISRTTSKFHARLDLEIEMYVFQTPASQVWTQICHIPHCKMSTVYGALAHIVLPNPVT
jgi:hypothetical protein